LGLERHVIDPLAQIGALALDLVLCLVNAPTKLADLLFQRVHTRQQLSDQIAAPSGRRGIRGRRTGGRNVAPSCTLVLQDLNLASQFQNLVLQCDPFATFDLRAGRSRWRQENKQHNQTCRL
jgi:hypothetical protein